MPVVPNAVKPLPHCVFGDGRSYAAQMRASRLIHLLSVTSMSCQS